MKFEIGKKIVSVFLVACMVGMTSFAASCGHDHKTEVVEPTPLPTETSADLDLYVYESLLYRASGERAEGYVMDVEGNVLDNHKQIVIAAANVVEFTVPAEVKWDEALTAQKLESYRLEDGSVAATPVTFELDLTINPEDALNTEISIESNDPGALYFPYDLNKELLDGVDAPESNIVPAINLSSFANPVKVTLTGCFEGTYYLTVRNILDQDIGKIEIKLEQQLVEPDAENEETTVEHTHTYTEIVVDPTYKTQGYTLHVCSVCGNTFRDNYVDKLVCQHDYIAKVVAPTYSEKGYTRYTCSICGDTYTADETPQLVCAHTWDNGSVTKKATCTSEGVRTYKCTTCGATKTETISRTAHTMKEEVVAPTYSSEGYTRHYCSVCGYETAHTDIKPAKVHEHTYSKSVVAPTCENIGYTIYTCTVCGDSYTDNQVPATGHKYVDTVVAATCEAGGYTEHVCSVCGASYRDQETAALGHDWEEHVERVRIRQEAHEICAECGLDLTANGIKGGAIVDHVKEHALAGGGTRSYTEYVDIYEERVSYVCVQCGTTK